MADRRRQRTICFRWLAVASAGLLLPAPLAAQTRQRTSAWSAVDCDTFDVITPENAGIECGYITVPRRHAEPGGPTIQLATVVLPAVSSPRQSDPLFMAQGGPGGSTIDTYAQVLIDDPSLRPTSNRDIVLWDQRGTLYSKPALMCPEVSTQDIADAQAGTDDDAKDEAAYVACGVRLAKETGDLSAFNSAENADDIEDLRTALGYNAVNFYGVSYGTELGQFLMRQHPGRLRSVVLDAVVPLSYNLFTEPAFAQQRIGEKYFNGCAADPRCNAAFPNLTARYLALIERLDKNPATVYVISDTDEAKRYEIKLTGELLGGALYESLYSDVHRLIPLIVDRADRGDYTYVSALLLPLSLFDETMALGMHEAVACAERGDTDPDAVDYSAILPRLAEETRKDAREELKVCNHWGIQLLPRASLEPVASDIPTLLMSGDFDPITPPEYAAALLPTLSKGKYVVFPTGTHGQAVTSACANGIIRRFLDNPVADIDSSCIVTAVPAFATEKDVITVPALRRLLAGYGFAGVMALAIRSIPGAIGVGLLLTALLVYPVAWLITRRRRESGIDNRGTGPSLVAPWIAGDAALMFTAFFVGLAIAVANTLETDQNMLAMGAIPSRWWWLFVLPPMGALMVALMVVTAVVMWVGRYRSLAGRIYFTLLTFAGIGTVLSLVLMGVMGLWRG